MFNTRLVFLWLLFLLASISHAVNAEGIRYVSILDSIVYVEFDEEGNSVRFMDSRGPANYCEKKEEYNCVGSKSFSFAIPKEEYAFCGKWEFMGESYECRGEVELELFGKKYSGFRVRSDRGDLVIAILYSFNKGILHFSLIDKKSGLSREYVLADSAGLWAKKYSGTSTNN